MTTTAKQYAMYAALLALAALYLLFPEHAFAGGGDVVRGKIDGARSNFAIPVAGGIAAIGSIASVVLWLLDVVDWKNMAKWILGAIMIGAIAGVILENLG